jgi:hypothetical protein
VIRYNSLLFLLVVLACLVQHFVPPIKMAGNAHLLLVPVVFLSAALTGGVAMMLFLAFVGGFLWDCHHCLNMQPLDETIYIENVESLPFGYSIILYAIMGAITLGFTPLFRSGKWQIPTLITGVSIYIYLWIEFLLIMIIRGGFIITIDVLIKISLSSLLSMSCIPFMLFILGKLASSCKHTIQDDNRRRYFSPTKV